MASSANNIVLNFDARDKSLMYHKKSKRPRTEPYGMP